MYLYRKFAFLELDGAIVSMARDDAPAESICTKLKLRKGFEFNVSFDVADVPELVVDEIKPIGESAGPNPTRLLSAAVGHCISSSLLFCLRKARINVKDLETEVKANVVRNEEGYLRVKSLDVQIRLDVNEDDKSRVDRCLGIFENYCIVTQSVRKGLDVKLAIN
jgi:uncharacterized OsmC-like protein